VRFSRFLVICQRLPKKGVSKIAELKDRLEFIQPVVHGEQAVASLQLALEAICEAIVSKLGYEVAWIRLNDEIILEAKQATENGFDEGFFPPTMVGHGALALDNDTRGTDKGTIESRSAISFPLNVGDVIIGTLGVYSDKEDAFSPEEARILEILSETAALAIEKANVNVSSLNLGITSKDVKRVLKKLVEPGGVYLFRGSLEELLQLFKNHLEGGWSGLLIGGRLPEEIQRVERLRTVPTFQITGDASLVNAVWSYSGLTILVSSFMHATEKPLIIIDRLEELERSIQRGYLPLFIEDLRKQVSEVNGAAIIRMDSIENKWLDTLDKYCTFI